MKNTYLVTGLLAVMALSYALGWYMQGYTIYRGIFAGTVAMMPHIGAK